MAGELVLVTGATGMIGFRTLVFLLEAGYKARAAVRNQAGFDKISQLKPVAPYASQLTSVIVPDITVPGAYDEAVKGVDYIVHVASPLASNAPPGIDHESYMIQPAIRGTVGILESAAKTTGIKKIVITGSILSLVDTETFGSGSYINEETRTTTAPGPYSSHLDAYAVAKATAFNKTKEWVAETKPSFSVNHVFPVFVLGRDDTVTTAEQIIKGTNNLLMGPLFGSTRPPIPGGSVHLDDVARLHVLALDPKVESGQDFLAASQPLEPFQWSDAASIIKKHFPKAAADGIFQLDNVEKVVTRQAKVDSTKAEKLFGFKFKNYEEQVQSVVSHYLELAGKN
ncbi:uncharacterized protein Triagg1_20 [Trichoderma aggressivum f. europaeum]|uniref:NAD-dependent epimerase/dehydratase domain-containing protein n=1 Tax=Trichoderma aggressivum f. europaeum TaxID=173218 RepID=A0AAE1M3E2_9HYPO|nr:hypothetical protein Triagg1_20 [Trichoderma aggressivum f. europaeum]